MDSRPTIFTVNASPSSRTISKYYLRLSVDDRPGVLAQIAGALGELGIGILSVIQPESQSEGSAALVLMIHDAAFRTDAGCRRKESHRSLA